jgi:hypothetical protein
LTDFKGFFSSAGTMQQTAFKPIPIGWYNGDIAIEIKSHEQAALGEAVITIKNLTAATSGLAEVEGVRIGGRILYERLKLGWVPKYPEFPAGLGAADVKRLTDEIEEKAAMVNAIAKQRLLELAWAAGVATREKVDHDWVITPDARFEGDPLALVAEVSGKRVGFRVSKHRAYTAKSGEERVQEQLGGFRPAQ